MSRMSQIGMIRKAVGWRSAVSTIDWIGPGLIESGYDHRDAGRLSQKNTFMLMLKVLFLTNRPRFAMNSIALYC